ncbi:MAG TPA: DUF503 domain-containing protein [Candidatus Eisenbacteria bacterium]|nr:DUF503 domain-containing protein [Candidatus Eisenbacteria bacterium]
MFVGIVRIELHIPAATSLKDKRSVVRSLKERIRQRAQASVAEVDYHDLWQRAALGVAVVSGESRQIDELLQVVRNLVEGTFEAQLLDWQENRS